MMYPVVPCILLCHAMLLCCTVLVLCCRVVPCSPKVGVVQWVEGTQPMMDYLAAGQRREGGACAR